MTFDPPTSPDTRNATSSPALAGGHTRSGLPDGLTIVNAGQGAPRVNHTHGPTRGVAGWQMNGTFGRNSPVSCSTRGLQSCLVSSLRTQLPTVGSTKLPLTWKTRTTPGRRSVFLLVRSGRSTKGSVFGLLPTLASRDYRHPNARPYSERGGGAKGQQLPEHLGGPLSPAWCLSFMGFPAVWEESRPRATRSSRRSPKPSSKPTATLAELLSRATRARRLSTEILS